MNRMSQAALRLLGLATVLGLALTACTTPPGAPTVVREAAKPPPPLAAGPHTDTYWGVTLADPFRRLEDTRDAQVQQWMRAQADATASTLARIPGRQPMLERMREIEGSAGGLTSNVVRTDGGRFFFMRRNPGQDQFSLVWRDGPDGTDHVIVDPEALSKAAGRPHAVLDFAPSRDGSRLAYAIQVGGGEIGTLHVVDVATGRELSPPVDRIRFGSVAWLDDGSGLFYSRLREGYEKLPPTERFNDRQRWFRALDGRQADQLVMSPSHNPELKLPVYASAYVFQPEGTQLAVAWVFLGVERNTLLFVADLAAVRRGQAAWRPVFDVADQVRDVAVRGTDLFLRTARDAKRFRILKLDLRQPEMARAQVLVPESDAVLTGMGAARDGLYFTRREGVLTQLYRLPVAGGTPQRLELPVQGEVGISSASPRQDGVLVQLSGWTRMAKDWVVDGTGRATRLKLAVDGAFDAPENIESREVQVTSHDGVKVPLSIISKKGLALDGRNPTIVYGYGAYGSTDEPYFNPRLLAFLEQGGVFAVAHVRGGGLFGDAWHDAGKKATKPNTWKDGIAAAEWLIANGWTSRERVGIYGGSAGGIFVGRAITERPDLFAAAVPMVGVMDAVRAETSANGVANIPEFGSVKDEAGFKALLAMSSLHHVKDGVRYPAVLLSHGVNDIRVEVWNSSKFASRVVQAQQGLTGTRPVLLRLEYEAGHGSGSTRAQAQERSADIYAFFLWQFGAPGFQPRQP